MQIKSLHADLLLASAMLIVAAVLFVGGLSLPASRFEPMGPSGMPLTVAVVLAALSIVLLVSSLAKHRSKPSADQGRTVLLDTSRRMSVLACVLVSLVYLLVLAFELLPFMIATVAYLIAYGSIEGGFQRRSLVVLVASALIIGVGTSLILSEVLVVPLPGA